jgi:hypothetical protein
MPYIAGTLQPAETGQLYCPRCWFTGPFDPVGSLTLRCSRCEWPFTAAASTAPAPSVPASTVGYVNASGSPMAVTLSTFTLTFVYVNTVQVGTTNTTYYVPVAGTISVTYSVAGTWSWALIQTSGALSAGGTAITVTHGGAAFAYGQVLVIDPAGTSDIVTVNGTPSDTSVPCTALGSSHGSGKNITVAQLTPALSGTGLNGVPQVSY